MHQRPQRTVAHAVVVLGNVAIAEFDEGKLEARILSRKRKSRRSFLAPVPGNPESTVPLEQTQEGGAYAADGRLDALLAAFAHHFDRRAIGHDDQFAAAEDVRDVSAVEAWRECYALGSSHQVSQVNAENQTRSLLEDELYFNPPSSPRQPSASQTAYDVCARTNFPILSIACCPSGRIFANACHTWIMSSHTSSSTLTPCCLGFRRDLVGIVKQGFRIADLDQQRSDAAIIGMNRRRQWMLRIMLAEVMFRPSHRGCRNPPSGHDCARVLNRIAGAFHVGPRRNRHPRRGHRQLLDREFREASPRVKPPPAESPAITILFGL